MSSARYRGKDGRSNPDSNDADTHQTTDNLIPKRPRYLEEYEENSNRIGIVDIFRTIFLLFLISSGLSYYLTSNSIIWGYQRPWFTKWPNGPLQLSPAELSLYNGTSTDLPLYVSVNYTIFDVSANRGMYGPGGGYSFFGGRDATRAFVTGCFADDLTPDMTGVEIMYIPIEDVEDEGLSNAEKKIRRERELRAAKANVRKQVKHWQDFFAGHAKYFEVGKLVGEPVDEQKGKRELCDAAKKNRPKRSELNKTKASGRSEPTYPPGVKKDGR
ncbi:hypothetical protein FQN57_000136 [Myotisia sp. PD_48]|nr:hypothetical protein FQN57_000136 [Myotisia sp. PD_48]